MAKKRGKSNDEQIISLALSEVEKRYIIDNFKDTSIDAMAKSLGKTQEEVKQFISDLIKTPGSGLSRQTYAKKGGVTMATGVSSERGDSHNKKASNYVQYTDAIHKPLGS